MSELDSTDPSGPSLGDERRARALAATPVSVSWLPGEHFGVAWTGGVAVLDRGAGAEAVGRLWHQLEGDLELDAFVDVLLQATGRRTVELPGFAAALHVPGADRGVLLAARGSFVASARGAVDRSVTGGGVATWSERTAEDVEWIAVRSAAPAAPTEPADEEDELLPLLSGVVRARRLQRPRTPQAAGSSATAPAWRMTADRPAAAAPVVHDGATIHSPSTSARPLGLVPAPGAPSTPGPRPWRGPGTPVLGELCSNSHPNRPGSDSCRYCAAPVAGPPRPVARPSLGRLTTSSGQDVDIEAAVVVGRAPRARAGREEEAVLVTIPEPHVSATHLEIRPDGWDVTAADLDSTNGTFLCRRGEQPVRLTSVPARLASGDVLDLGHGAQVRVGELP
ncbi:FHA domain-containing protein [Nocardioides zeae]|uniref:FHA domain-containing protein n=1 Tax=Nocardioides imazamoxiresistens TaxID=3231893 RepID=A0ABU3PZ45_9ACTN|nr:FHA domain-containing protein [Nocardioides zeae]MDT9594521.1 FHA domain-containing protein [Nocardioides zeae]